MRARQFSIINKREIYYIKIKYESLLTPMGLMHILHNDDDVGLIKNVIIMKKKVLVNDK